MRVALITVLLAAAAAAATDDLTAQADHDFTPGLAGRVAPPALARFAAAVGPICIVLPEEMEPDNRRLVVGVAEGRVSPAELEAVLAAGGALEEARALSRALVGLGNRPRPGQGAEAIEHFNALVRRSSEEFLRNPPPEFLAVHEIVRYQSTGAAPAQPAWVCPAPPRIVPPPVIPTVVEQPVEICVALDNDLRIITATYRPATGDTLLGGVPFREAHAVTAPDYASAAPWFVQSDSLQFGGQLYVRFGLTRRMGPEEVQRVGLHEGTAVFAEPGAATPYPALFVPVRPGCVLQPYQRREALRVRG
jgi:hypothetical protein